MESMHIRKGGVVQRVSIVALSVLIWFNSGVTAKANTIDDLREMIGLTRSTEEEYMEYIASIINSYNMIENHNELVSIVNNYGVDLNKSSDLEGIKKELDTQENDFKQLVKNGGNINEIQSKLHEVEKNKKNYENLEENLKMEKKKDEKIKNKYEKEYKHVMLLLDNIGDKTDIGGIGNEISMPTLGNTILSDIEVTKKRVRSVQIKSNRNGTIAVSMLNGVIENIKKYKKKYIIKLKVTPLLYVYYSGLNRVDVSKGDIVTAGNILGSAKNKFSLKVKLDETSINPLILMGRRGWNMYSSWKMHNNDTKEVVMVESDFCITDFKSEYIEKEEDEREIRGDKRVFRSENGGELIFDSNYTVPDANIIE